MAAKKRGPAVARRQLRKRLREARSNANLTQSEAAELLDWSPSKILRIENGQTSVAVSDLYALLAVYPSLADEREELVDLTKSARQSSELAHKYSDVLSPDYREWVEYEAYAVSIQQYEPQVVPGVLQTSAYALSLVGVQRPKQAAERLVDARLERSEPLTGPEGPKMEFIIDESALRRAVTARDAKNQFKSTISQLEALKKMNTKGRAAMGETIEAELNPNISIQIVPLSFGPYLAMRHPFELIEFDDDDLPNMMYFEAQELDTVIRDKYEEIEKYFERFADLKKRAPGPTETSAQLDFIIEQMRGGNNGPFPETMQSA